jgi:hypothetical protein
VRYNQRRLRPKWLRACAVGSRACSLRFTSVSAEGSERSYHTFTVSVRRTEGDGGKNVTPNVFSVRNGGIHVVRRRSRLVRSTPNCGRDGAAPRRVEACHNRSSAALHSITSSGAVCGVLAERSQLTHGRRACEHRIRFSLAAGARGRAARQCRFYFRIGRGHIVMPTAPPALANDQRHRNRPAAAIGS